MKKFTTPFFLIIASLVLLTQCGKKGMVTPPEDAPKTYPRFYPAQ